MEVIEPPADPHPIHVATAEDIANLHGYDQVIIYARKAGTKEWVTTWGRSPVDKQAAAQIGACIRNGVVEPLEHMRGLLAEAARLMPRLIQSRRALAARIEEYLKPIELIKKKD